MDGAPLRVPPSSDRRVVNRSEQQRQSVENATSPEPRQSVRAGSSSSRYEKEKKSPKKLLVTMIIILALLVLGAIGWFVWSQSKSTGTGIDGSRYQTVYLMNGQIYFGKLSVLGDNHYKLTNVYFLLPQQTQEDDESGETTTNVSAKDELVRLSKAIYDPEDEMIISRDQLLYFQNLRSDSRASQLIENDKR